MGRKSYYKSVFINCPIDERYKPLFRAAVFTVLKCDFNLRSAIEEDDSSEIRLQKIFRMISECRFGIHDLSRTQLSQRSNYPRFNMPLELGIFLGAKYFGEGVHDKKICIIFERTLHSYETFISDIKGQDIKAHKDKPELVVKCIRDWLVSNNSGHAIPSGDLIYRSYRSFIGWLPGKCRKEKLKINKLVYSEFVNLVYEWISLGR